MPSNFIATFMLKLVGDRLGEKSLVEQHSFSLTSPLPTTFKQAQVFSFWKNEEERRKKKEERRKTKRKNFFFS